MVSGPIGVLIAQQSEYGWGLPEVDTWRAPGGESQFTMDTRSPIAHFVKWVCQQTRLVIWDRTARYYMGSGFGGWAGAVGL